MAESAFKKAMQARRAAEEAKQAAARPSDDDDDGIEVEWAAKPKEPAKGRQQAGRKRGADAEAHVISDSDEDNRGGAGARRAASGAKRGRMSAADADFERQMAELNDPKPAGVKAASKRGGKAASAVASAASSSSSSGSALLAETDLRLARIREKTEAANRLAAAAQAGQLPDDVLAAASSASSGGAGAAGKASPKQPAKAAAAAPAAKPAQKRTIILKVSMKDDKGEPIELSYRLDQPLSKAIDYMREKHNPKGHLKFEGRTLKGTDTPASALDAEDAWQDAQESGEDATVQVDFVVP